MKVLAIDPGNTESGFILWDGKTVLAKGKVSNKDILYEIKDKLNFDPSIYVAIEMVASYGMPVGKEVFETCVWIGRFYQASFMITKRVELVYRKDIKLHICGVTKAKDSNIICALVDRFGNRNIYGKYGKGTIKNKGLFFGFSADVWQAFALAAYYYDNYLKK